MSPMSFAARARRASSRSGSRRVIEVPLTAEEVGEVYEAMGALGLPDAAATLREGLRRLSRALREGTAAGLSAPPQVSGEIITPAPPAAAPEVPSAADLPTAPQATSPGLPDAREAPTEAPTPEAAAP
jgi:hypothetical protein